MRIEKQSSGTTVIAAVDDNFSVCRGAPTRSTVLVPRRKAVPAQTKAPPKRGFLIVRSRALLLVLRASTAALLASLSRLFIALGVLTLLVSVAQLTLLVRSTLGLLLLILGILLVLIGHSKIPFFEVSTNWKWVPAAG